MDDILKALKMTTSERHIKQILKNIIAWLFISLVRTFSHPHSISPISNPHSHLPPSSINGCRVVTKKKNLNVLSIFTFPHPTHSIIYFPHLTHSNIYPITLLTRLFTLPSPYSLDIYPFITLFTRLFTLSSLCSHDYLPFHHHSPGSIPSLTQLTRVYKKSMSSLRRK